MAFNLKKILSNNISRQEAIENHIEKYVGKIHMVLHEISSPDFHLDLYWVKTNILSEDVNVLITSGMSENKMIVPEGMESFQFAELCIILPNDWKINSKDFENEENYWPIRLIKDLARYPHENKTWVGIGHTIENDHNTPYTETVKFTGSIIFHPIFISNKFWVLKHNDNQINFYNIMPLYPEEIQYKLTNGTNVLIDKFIEASVNQTIDSNRKNTCN